MTDVAPHSIPKEPGGPRAVALAVVVHLALLVFLWVGISWQSQTPGGVEAEVWDMQYREAAPQEPQKQQEKPVNKTPPPPVSKAVEKAQVVKPALSKPDIALEQKKKRKAEAEAKKKAEDEKRKKDADKKAADKKAALEKSKHDKAEAAAKKKQDLADKKMRDRMRTEDLRRIQGAVGTGGNGTAIRSTGMTAAYANKIGAKIRSNTNYVVPAGLSGNPNVVYVVELFPDGTLKRPPRKKKSSGLPGFDEAVFRAIEKSVPFPRDSNGKVPGTLEVDHKPKDM